MAEKKSKNEKTEGNTEVNGNLESFSISQHRERKTRFFSLTTYATEKQIQKVVGNHISSLRALCYIYHDKDEAEPHYHVLMRTHSTWTARQIGRWFADLKDAEKKPINTFCESAGDMEALKLYVLHQDQKSIEEGKHRYEISDLRDYGFHDLAEKKDSYDGSYEILLKVLAGANPRDLVKYYGRDYLYHYNQYMEVAELIRRLEGYGEARLKSALEIANFTPLEDMEEFEK